MIAGLAIAAQAAPASGLGAGGVLGNDLSLAGDISPNGRYLAFQSQSDNLDPADSDDRDDIYMRDLQTGATTLISRADGLAGAKGNSSSYVPAMADGRYVAFDSTATNLSPDDPDTANDIYVRDVVANTTTLVTRASGAAGPKANAGANNPPSISANGRYVAFLDGRGQPQSGRHRFAPRHLRA